MLRTLSIRNFAIIDHLDLEFGPGLSVLTGETGAGKSIIVGALTAILGGRAGADVVRGGAHRASIDAIFDVGRSPGLLQLVADLGYEVEDGQLYLSREIAAEGRSGARIGGRPATVAQLREIGDWLVDLHGQHEHQSLLSVPRHIDMLDEWGGSETLALRASAGDAYRTVRDLKHERAALETDARDRAHLMDLYQFQVQEIAQAALAAGEDAELEAEARRLANAQRLAEAAASAATAIGAEDGSGVGLALAAALRELDAASAIDERLQPIAEALRSAMYEMEEAAHDLVRYGDDIEHNPERLEQIQDRLELIRTLKRKYGDTIEEVVRYGEQTSAKLAGLTNSEERVAELDRAVARAEEQLRQACAELTEQRRRLGCRFAESVVAELADLAMERTRFEVKVEPAPPGPSGADRVEFLIAPNPGEPQRPLAKIASGGEISRVMLAIKSAMARQEPLPTMVFDEIDAGVGGRTASVIADKLAALSHQAQILCITHLPQIASRGAEHLCIEKQVDGDRTTVSVKPLAPGERVGEIARMLGGSDVTETVLRHAREMLGVDGEARRPTTR